MIRTALSFIADEINNYLKVLTGLSDNLVVLSTYTNLDGSVATKNIDKVCITLLTIEQEGTIRNLVEQKRINDEYMQINPPIRLNLSVLFGTTFNDYEESLKFLSYVIAFFQGKSVFTHHNSPMLAPQFDKLVLEMKRTELHDWNQLWSMLGGKHIPGVVYKMKMLTIQEELIKSSNPAVLTLNQNVI